MKKFIILVLVTSSLYIYSNDIDLDSFACKTKVDKGSWGHNYTKQYSQFFSPLRKKPIRLLEIGFCHGISAVLWEKYFTNPDARFFFIDIDRTGFRFLDRISRRSQLDMVDQSNNELNEYINKIGGNLDIIIDDGSHHTQHQIYSFKVLFPHLKSGGIYVVEDLFGSYWKSLGGGGTLEHPKPSQDCAVSFFANLIHELNFVAARNRFANIDVCPAHIKDKLTYYQKHIESIQFFSNICFIFKR